jgi:hypothetical protein
MHVQYSVEARRSDQSYQQKNWKLHTHQNNVRSAYLLRNELHSGTQIT